MVLIRVYFMCCLMLFLRCFCSRYFGRCRCAVSREGFLLCVCGCCGSPFHKRATKPVSQFAASAIPIRFILGPSRRLRLSSIRMKRGTHTTKHAHTKTPIQHLNAKQKQTINTTKTTQKQTIYKTVRRAAVVRGRAARVDAARLPQRPRGGGAARGRAGCAPRLPAPALRRAALCCALRRLPAPRRAVLWPARAPGSSINAKRAPEQTNTPHLNT